MHPLAFMRMSASGSSPAKEMASQIFFRARYRYIWFAARRTSERAPAQVEFCDIIAELADVARQREALVAKEGHVAALGLHADEIKRELACAKFTKSVKSIRFRARYN